MLQPLRQKKLCLSYHHISELYFRDLIDPAVSREIIEQPLPLRNELKSHLVKLIADADAIHSSGFMIDFDIERAFNNPEISAKIRDFIKTFSYFLYNSDNKLLLPVRVPFLDSVKSAEQYLEFLKKQMLPELVFSIDIHPHELAGKEFSPGEIMKWLEFDTILLRFVYEPSTGNRLVSKSFEPWIKYMKKHCSELRIVFSPVFRNLENVENEINLFEQLVSDLNNL
jgi:hypothetical protein